MFRNGFLRQEDEAMEDLQKRFDHDRSDETLQDGANQYKSNGKKLRNALNSRDRKVAVILCCGISFLGLFVLATLIGSILLIVYGSICISDQDFTKCGDKTRAILMIVFGILIFISCSGIFGKSYGRRHEIRI